MALAKPLKCKPRDVATSLAEKLGPKLSEICESPEIAGPGFINLKLKDGFVAAKVKSMVGDGERLGISRCEADACFVLVFPLHPTPSTAWSRVGDEHPFFSLPC